MRIPTAKLIMNSSCQCAVEYNSSA